MRTVHIWGRKISFWTSLLFILHVCILLCIGVCWETDSNTIQNDRKPKGKNVKNQTLESSTTPYQIRTREAWVVLFYLYTTGAFIVRTPEPRVNSECVQSISTTVINDELRIIAGRMLSIMQRSSGGAASKKKDENHKKKTFPNSVEKGRVRSSLMHQNPLGIP